MSKFYRTVNPQQASTSAAAAGEFLESDTEWDKCVICQKVTDEVLQSPSSVQNAAPMGQATLLLQAYC